MADFIKSIKKNKCANGDIVLDFLDEISGEIYYKIKKYFKNKYRAAISDDFVGLEQYFCEIKVDNMNFKLEIHDMIGTSLYAFNQEADSFLEELDLTQFKDDLNLIEV